MISIGLVNFWHYYPLAILAFCYLVAEVQAKQASLLNNFDEISGKGGKKSSIFSSGQSKEVVESTPHWNNAPDVVSAIHRSFEG